MPESGLVEARFDYAVIEKDQQGRLRYCASEIQKQKASVAVSIMAIGEMLSVAHEQLAGYRHGTFQKWIESECGFSKTSAYRYIDAFRVFSNCPTVGQIEDSAMYALAQKDTPEKALKEVLKLAEKGVRVTQKQAKEIIKKHTEPKAEQDEAVEEEHEEEPEIEEEPTIEEICDADNKAIEGFCRAIVKYFDKEVPRLPWTEDSGRIDSAIASLKAGLTTLRGAKAEVCPACAEGLTEKGKCRYCKGHGYLPTYQAKAIPEDARL